MSVTSETLMNKAVTGAVLVVNGGVAVKGKEIITAADLDAYIFMGITAGAWMKIFLGISLLIIILLNLKKLWVEIIRPLGRLIRREKK